MSLASLYNTIVCLSPRLEVFFRKIYWHNINLLRRFKPKFRGWESGTVTSADFSRIIELLKNSGVGKGSLVIVHSSYDTLKRTGLSADAIIDALLELIGEEGTLVMPVTRMYKEQPRKGNAFLTYNTDNLICTYNVQKTPIHTGLLPYMLMRRRDSVTSRHPLSTATALGPLAKPMMEHNLEGDKPASHGPNSSWKFCFDHNALVVGLGIDLVHYLTVMHVAEDAFSDWPVKGWYRERKFNIVDKDFKQQFVVKERKPRWGTLYIADRNLKKQLLKEHILHIKNSEGIEISFLNAKTYISYIRMMNNKTPGYPYVIPKKDIICSQP
jgi:aminoglycoside 3-N-acetyltransferase